LTLFSLNRISFSEELCSSLLNEVSAANTACRPLLLQLLFLVSSFWTSLSSIAFINNTAASTFFGRFRRPSLAACFHQGNNAFVPSEPLRGFRLHWTCTG
jgi:hypothetical protein